MKVWVRWHAGASYSPGDMEDIEVFDTMSAAEDALRDRVTLGHNWKQHFEYVNKTPDDVFTPVVEQDSEMWVYFRDPTDEHDPHPDRIFKFGPRGAVRRELA